MTWAEMLAGHTHEYTSVDGATATRDSHVVLNRREERLQPFIRGGVRKIAGKDLEERER